jgi:hypothetical protein
MAIGVNVKRRNMTPPQKRELVAQELRYLARHYQDEDEPTSWDNQRLSRHLAVGPGLVRDVRRSLEEDGDIPFATILIGERTSPGGLKHEVRVPREKPLPRPGVEAWTGVRGVGGSPTLTTDYQERSDLLPYSRRFARASRVCRT